MSEGRPSQLIFSKQFGKLQFDCNIQLGRAGQGGREGQHGLHKRVSEIVFVKLNERNPRNKAPLVKKSGGNPFVENLSQMEGKGPKIGPTMANLAAMRRIFVKQ